MNTFKFKLEGKPYEVNILSAEGNVLDLNVNGKKYSVELEQSAPVPTPTPVAKPVVVSAPAATPVAPAAPTAPVAAASSGNVNTIKSPLPGSILKIVVAEGTTVKEGDVLLVMESMKMENNITAEQAGTVQKIYIAVGQNVMQDDALFDLA